ncbi:MAG: hypothetical protein JOZ69_21555, partial [Myxococcales bacterium]|nr:hypothetical protein [Myxococcales bacterium]
QADILAGTTLFGPTDAGAVGEARMGARKKLRAYRAALERGHGPAYWQRVMAGQNFAREDALDVEAFNRALWRGLMGKRPYPEVRAGSRRPDIEQAPEPNVPWCPRQT